MQFSLSLALSNWRTSTAIIFIDAFNYYLIAMQIWSVSQIVAAQRFELEYFIILGVIQITNILTIAIRYRLTQFLIDQAHGRSAWERLDVTKADLSTSFMSKGIQTFANTASLVPSLVATPVGITVYLFALGARHQFLINLTLSLLLPLLVTYLIALWRLRSTQRTIAATDARSKAVAKFKNGASITLTQEALNLELECRASETRSDEARNILPTSLILLSFLILNSHQNFAAEEASQLLLTSVVLVSRVEGFIEGIVQIASLSRYRLTFRLPSTDREL
jgi:hypothetical protein